jgi:hypothetical protein
MTHQCPTRGCKRNLPDHLLMCRPHWYQVPYHLRRAVWNAYDGGAGVGTWPLRVAQANAIEAVNAKLAGGGR